MRRFKLLAVSVMSVILLTLCLAVSPLYAGDKESPEASFFVSFWSGDWLPTYVPKLLLEDHLGYQVKIESISVPAGFAAISSGQISLTVITWMPNNGPLVKKYIDKTMVNLGVMYPDCLQTLFIPKWVADEYQIKKISDLDNPEYAKMFDIDMDKKGDWIGCDPAWICAKMNDQCIELYGLEKLYVQMMGDEHLLSAATKGRMQLKKPVLVSQFYPHIMFLDYPMGESMVPLEDEKQFWPKMQVEKFANKTWAEKNPKAAALLKQINMTTKDIMWSMQYIRENGDDPKTLEKMAREWMKSHQTQVDTWLKAVN